LRLLFGGMVEAHIRKSLRRGAAIGGIGRKTASLMRSGNDCRAASTSWSLS
jgi:hypothetical protein